MTNEEEIANEIKRIAKLSYACGLVSLNHITGMEICMHHDLATGKLRFRFYDSRLPNEYLKYVAPKFSGVLMDDSSVCDTVFVRPQTISLRQYKNRAFFDNYPYLKHEHPETMVATRFGFWGVPIKWESRKAWVDYKPDYEAVANIIINAIQEFKKEYDRNTTLIPKY